MKRITIIGKGKVGTSLARAIRASKGYELANHISARAKRFPKFQNEVVIIAAKDDKIAEIAKRLFPNENFWEWPLLVVHCAGSLAPEVLPKKPSVARMTLHPIQTFPKPDASLFKGISWMASSSDAEALQWAKQFTRSLGAKGLIALPSESLPLYHAMTVFSSNFITLLVQSVEQISKELKQDPKQMKAALRPLLESALQNALAKPAMEVLTGPIARNDVATISKHQQALAKLHPNLRKLYDAFVKMAEMKAP